VVEKLKGHILKEFSIELELGFIFRISICLWLFSQCVSQLADSLIGVLIRIGACYS
jgi:hypothetical protein